MNAFHICGALLALWAVMLSALGITREGFPATKRTMRLLIAISILLAAAAIGTGIYTSAVEEEEEPEAEAAMSLLLGSRS